MNLGLLIVLGVLNLWTFAAFGLDKRRAKKNQPRTPEATLLLLAAVGGAIGAWFAVRLFRHKSSKKAFLLPLIIATIVGALAWYTILDLLWQTESGT